MFLSTEVKIARTHIHLRSLALLEQSEVSALCSTHLLPVQERNAGFSVPVSEHTRPNIQCHLRAAFCYPSRLQSSAGMFVPKPSLNLEGHATVVQLRKGMPYGNLTLGCFCFLGLLFASRHPLLPRHHLFRWNPFPLLMKQPWPKLSRAPAVTTEAVELAYSAGDKGETDCRISTAQEVFISRHAVRQVIKAFFAWVVVHPHCSTAFPDYNKIMIDSPSVYMIMLRVSTSYTCPALRWQINEYERTEGLMVMLLYCCESQAASMDCELGT